MLKNFMGYNNKNVISLKIIFKGTFCYLIPTVNIIIFWGNKKKLSYVYKILMRVTFCYFIPTTNDFFF